MFYLTLPSNSSMQYYPQNSASHFYTRLPQDVELNNDYEVGLSEIQLSNTYFNVEDKDCYLSYLVPNLNETGQPATKEHTVTVKDNSLAVAYHRTTTDSEYKEPTVKTVQIPGGLYDSNEFFIHQLNTLCKNELGAGDNGKVRVKFYYNRATKKVSMTLYEKSGVITFSSSLQRILGFSLHTFTGPGHFASEFIMDLNEDFKNVFVYSDLVSPRMVGDTMAPLLRIVPMSERKSQIVYRIYEKPHYVPLSRFQFNTTEILLTTDKGRPISFTSGSTVVTLHFRRRRPENF